MQAQITCNAQHHTCCCAPVLCAEERNTLPAAITRPSKHLWLGNMQLNVNKSALEAVFGNFGTLESVRIFPGKTYAFVNFANMEPAVEAMRCLDGQPLLSITGGAMQLAVLVLHLPVLHDAVSQLVVPTRQCMTGNCLPTLAVKGEPVLLWLQPVEEVSSLRSSYSLCPCRPEAAAGALSGRGGGGPRGPHGQPAGVPISQHVAVHRRWPGPSHGQRRWSAGVPAREPDIPARLQRADHATACSGEAGLETQFPGSP